MVGTDSPFPLGAFQKIVENI